MTKKKTHEDFVKDVYNLVGDEYTVVGKYTLSKNKVELRHNECGELWEVKANSFINGNRCKYCREESKMKTSNKYKKELHDKYIGNIEMVGKYIYYDNKLYHKCLKNKTVFTINNTNT